jgi:hypothetical protein
MFVFSHTLASSVAENELLLEGRHWTCTVQLCPPARSPPSTQSPEVGTIVKVSVPLGSKSGIPIPRRAHHLYW